MSVVAATTGCRPISRHGAESKEIVGRETPHLLELIRPLSSPLDGFIVAGHLDREGHQLIFRATSFRQELDSLFNIFTPCTSPPRLPRVAKVVCERSISGVTISRVSSPEFVVNQMERLTPDARGRFEQRTAERIFVRGLPSRGVTEAADIEAIRVPVQSSRILAAQPEVLGMEQSCTHDFIGGQINLMQEAESATEPELPPQALVVQSVAPLAPGRLRPVLADNLFCPGQGHTRQDSDLRRSDSHLPPSLRRVSSMSCRPCEGSNEKRASACCSTMSASWFCSSRNLSRNRARCAGSESGPTNLQNSS